MVTISDKSSKCKIVKSMKICNKAGVLRDVIGQVELRVEFCEAISPDKLRAIASIAENSMEDLKKTLEE